MSEAATERSRFLCVQLQAPPKRKTNWPELQRLVAEGDHIEATITEVNR